MIIKNGRVCLRHGFCEDVDIQIENGVISRIAPALDGNGDAQIIDAQGLIVAPGFCDVHIHGYGGVEMMQAGDAVQKMAEGLVKHGCTSFLPTTVCAPVQPTNAALRAVKQFMAAPSPGSATVLGSHMEGPFIEAAKKGAQDPAGIFAPSLDIYQQMTAGCDDTIRMITIAPEKPGACELAKALPAHVVKSVGHTLATAEQTAFAAECGFSQATHLFNAMPALNHREPGVPGEALANDAYSVQLIADLVHLHKSVLRLAYKAKGCARTILITDAIAATEVGDGNYKLGGLDIIVKHGEARLPEGNLAGSTLTIERAVRNMINTVGAEPHDALEMASRIPAESIGETRRGVIAEGYIADIVLLSPDYDVNTTIVGGAIAWRA